MRFLYLIALLPVTFAFVHFDDGCGCYDKCGRTDVRADLDACGPVCGYGKGSVYGATTAGHHDTCAGRYDAGGNYGFYDKECRDRCYDLNAVLCAGGKFQGCGTEDRGNKYCQVSKFRRGYGCDRCGRKRCYNDFDTCGGMKKYGGKDWRARVGLVGRVRAEGRYDLTGRGDSFEKMGDFGDYQSCVTCDDHRDTEKCADYAADAHGDLHGKVRTHADFDVAEKYRDHDYEYGRYPRFGACECPPYTCRDECDTCFPKCYSCEKPYYHNYPVCTKCGLYEKPYYYRRPTCCAYPKCCY